MSDLILMQCTINFMLKQAPAKLEAMGQAWNPKRDGEDKYFVNIDN